MNKTALITGASGGIGSQIAIDLAKNGFDLVLHCHKNLAKIDILIQEIHKIANIKIRTLQFSIADRAQTQNVINTDIAEHGAYYAVIYNAGIVKDNSFPAMLPEQWDDVLHTNLDGFYNVIQPTIMPMIRLKQGGRIITMASVSGITGNRGQTNYSASKGGLIAATKSLAVELAKRQITVNCIAPGIITTDMTKDIDDAIIKDSVPLRRAGKPSEVSSLVAYLLSDQAAYITRQVISVNGGMC